MSAVMLSTRQIRSAIKTFGSADGKMTLMTNRQPFKPNPRDASTTLRSTLRTRR